MNILITGANGFIGSHISNSLETNSHQIFRVVRENYQNLKNVIESDLTKINSPIKIIEELKTNKIDIIIHLAAKLTDSTQNKINQVSLLDDNINITKNVINLIKTLKPRKLINFSSIAVYPNIDGTFSEESQIKMSGNSECIYGLAKFCSENMFDFILNDQLCISHLRVAQVYGNGMRSDRIISILIQELKEKNTVTVYGNGERESNFINIKKLINILGYFINYDINGIYNIGDEPLSYLQLADKIVKEYGNHHSAIIKKPEGSTAKFKLNTSKLEKIISKYKYD